MNTSNIFEDQLLATKFFVPTPSGTLILRPRLMALLHQSLERSLTLVSAPAGFGKTVLLATWAQSLPAGDPHVAWVTLDEEENDPWLFWIYVLTAFDRQQPGCLTSVLTLLQSLPVPSLKNILTTLVNVLAEMPGQFLLILDDYQVITEPQVHTTLSYLVEHLPDHLHIILSTRVDPPFSLPLLRGRKLMLEVRANQLRCTAEETGAFFDQVMGIQFPEATIQEVTARMEGWLVGLQLLGLSLPERLNPLMLLREISGDQRYILDYLTEEVLHRQPPEVQTFLLSTCILERLNASLCNAVRQQDGSQQLLEQLEHANLFVTPLDSKRQWYRYHALFAEALRHQLEQAHGDLVPILSHRASIWYAEHNYPTEAIVHAFSAKEWQWAADLIEGLPLITFGCGISKRELMILRPWLEQLPAEVLQARPRLCFANIQILWPVAPHPVLEVWIDTAKDILTASLLRDAHEDAVHPIRAPQTRQQRQNLLAEIIAFHANLRSYREDGQAALEYCQQALALLSEHPVVRVHIAHAQLWALYVSSANNAGAAIDCGLQGGLLAQKIGQTATALGVMGATAGYMIGTGHLHEAQRLSQQAMLLGRQAGGFVLPEVGWPALFQAETLREWNHLDAAHALAEEALSQCKESRSTCSIVHELVSYEVLLRIHLSRGELDAARWAFQQVESIGMNMNRYLYLHVRSLFTTTDQVRLWLACGELDQAVRWAEALDVAEQDGTPLERERQEVARARIFLATKQPALALQRLEPVQERATTGKRWGHLIGIRLLQALAYEGLQEETRALNALSEALQMAEPEGYIRCFLDEGAPMEVLLYRLRRKYLQHGPTPYLDTVLAAFQHEHKELPHQPKRGEERPKMQALLDPLSEREREVLQLLACGASNQEIAEELVIAIDTVKRHVSHIFSKLGVHNRLQAERQAWELGLLREEH